MTNLYSTLKCLKNELSPMAVGTNTQDENGNVNSVHSITKKIIQSDDDPFTDRKPANSVFLRNDNLLKALQLGSEIRVEHQRMVLDPFDKHPTKLNPEIQPKSQDLELKKQPLDSNPQNPPPEKSSAAATSRASSGTRNGTKTKVSRKKKDEDDDVPLNVLEEMNKLEECFPVLSSNYRLIDKIGEGTFSTVYKAEALNGTVRLSGDIWKSPPLKKPKTTRRKPKNPIVALKQIYVTSSPNRIYNELNLLYILTGNTHIAPLLDVLRHQDQVVAILPYYPHADFRDFYRDLPVKGIKRYMWELFQGLEFVHNKGVVHRDLKPTNFLYDPFKGKGVLVDFGLAEKVGSVGLGSNACPCGSKDGTRRPRLNKRLNIKAAYPKQDQRPPRRANRAGTRGFRAPEVLLKCTNQSTKIDIWSAGIIGLCLFARKFPLFNSPDDTEALVELSIVFGLDKLQKCAELHGCGLEMNVNQSYTSGGNVLKLVVDSLMYEIENDGLPNDSVVYDTIKVLNENGDGFNEDLARLGLSDEDKELQEKYLDHKHLYDLLMGCFHMDPEKRLSSRDVMQHPFFAELSASDDDDVIL